MRRLPGLSCLVSPSALPRQHRHRQPSPRRRHGPGLWLPGSRGGNSRSCFSSQSRASQTPRLGWRPSLSRLGAPRDRGRNDGTLGRLLSLSGNRGSHGGHARGTGAAAVGERAGGSPACAFAPQPRPAGTGSPANRYATAADRGRAKTDAALIAVFKGRFSAASGRAQRPHMGCMASP